MSARKKPSARAERRAEARVTAKLVRERERLARYEPGGAPENPLAVSSASVVEVRALAAVCLGCGARHAKLEEHAARDFAGQRLRVVSIRCSRCSAPRTLYFRVGAPLAS